MALNAVRKLKNLRLDMRFANVAWLMGMTIGASVLVILLQVATLAIVLALLAMVERESMDREAGRKPGDSRVAANAIQAKLVGMDLRLGMAARAVTGCAGHDCRQVASAAFLIGVLSLQRENIPMIEVHH